MSKSFQFLHIPRQISTVLSCINYCIITFTSLEILRSKKGRSLCQPFQLLPSATKYPEYYRIITEPIDLKMIAQKIQAQQYKTLNDLEADLLLMVKNARTFNEPGSLIYKVITRGGVRGMESWAIL